MPGLLRAATVQNSAPLQPFDEVAAWILGSSQRRFAAAPPVDDEAERLSANLERWHFYKKAA